MLSKENGDPSELHDIDFLVYGRRSRTRRLTLEEKKAQLIRTINRVPEVVVKVSGGGKTTQHVLEHMKYIMRNGVLEAVNDQGEKISGKENVKDLHDSWDLDASNGQGKYRQAFNVVLSMPVGTNPDKLLMAVQNFAREKFYGKHQYMMVLHTQETDPHKKAPSHPHVHLVIKAEGFNGKRLYIRKATLEEWRSAFAEKLREQGIEANATPREIRGQTRKAKTPGVYFTEKRGTSNVLKNKFEETGQELQQNDQVLEPWEISILNRRRVVVEKLLGAAVELRKEGDEILATAIERYAKELPRPETERHQIKRAIVAQAQKRRVQEFSKKYDSRNNEKER